MNQLGKDWPRLRSILALVAGALVSLAVILGYPRLAAVIQITLAAVITAIAVGLHKWPRLTRPVERLSHAVVTVLIVMGLALFLAQILSLVQPMYVGEQIGWSLLAAVLAGTTTAVLLTGGRRKWVFTLFLATYAVALIGILHAFTVNIDVILFQEEASKALLRGSNPYTVVYPDIYIATPGIFYGEGVSVDGILQFGFPYTPLSLLVVAPFQWLFGDFRIAQALAVIGAGWLMSRLSDDPISRLVAVAFLLISPAALVVAWGWTEPLLVFASVLVMFTFKKRRTLAPYAMGALVGLKQYAVLLLPSYLLLLDHPIRSRDVVRAGLRIAAVLVVFALPFLLWNPDAFLESVVFLQFRQPIRMDSLSILN